MSEPQSSRSCPVCSCTNTRLIGEFGVCQACDLVFPHTPTPSFPDIDKTPDIKIGGTD